MPANQTDWRVRPLRGRRVVVVGLGRSGRAAARLLLREGARVLVTDSRTGPQIARAGESEAVAALSDAGALIELGGHTEETFEGADLIVKSPGVSPRVPALAAARAAGLPIIGEVELCAPFLTAPVAAITGTNGKSTTTALAAHLLRAAGRRVFAGANLGTPVAEHVLSGEPAEVLVLELSSYQIDDLASLGVDVAAILNVTPDHLERYGEIGAYAASKQRLLSFLRPGGTAVLGTDSPPVAEMARGLPAGPERPRVVSFGAGFAAPGEVRARGSRLTRALTDGTKERYELRVRSLRGAHNAQNAMAALEIARTLGAPPEAVQAGLDSYPGLPHRLEVVRALGGVEWVNDSKATNVDSVEKSLAALPGPLHLVLGGRGKGAPYAPLRPLFPGRVARLYLVGEDAERIAQELGDLAPIERSGTLENAVAEAFRRARPGETVLLSPACASFDQFRSFEDRGETFRRLVEALPGEARHAG